MEGPLRVTTRTLRPWPLKTSDLRKLKLRRYHGFGFYLVRPAGGGPSLWTAWKAVKRQLVVTRFRSPAPHSSMRLRLHDCRRFSDRRLEEINRSIAVSGRCRRRFTCSVPS
jgi:hypothetical protein